MSYVHFEIWSNVSVAVDTKFLKRLSNLTFSCAMEHINQGFRLWMFSTNTITVHLIHKN